MKRIRYLSIGSISVGTTVSTDILHNAAWELEQCCKRNKGVRKIDLRSKKALALKAFKFVETFNDEDPEDESEADDLLDELKEALEAFAPPHCYVGFAEWDGACFGCFVSHEGIEAAVRDGEITKIDDWDEADGPGQYLLVNDHGNMSLYTRFANHKTREEWSTV